MDGVARIRIINTFKEMENDYHGPTDNYSESVNQNCYSICFIIEHFLQILKLN